MLGELASEGLATLEGGNIAIADIATFQEFTGVYGEVDRIDLIFTRPLTADKLDRVKALLPAGCRTCAALGGERNRPCDDPGLRDEPLGP